MPCLALGAKENCFISGPPQSRITVSSCSQPQSLSYKYVLAHVNNPVADLRTFFHHSAAFQQALKDLSTLLVASLKIPFNCPSLFLGSYIWLAGTAKARSSSHRCLESVLVPSRLGMMREELSSSCEDAR